MVQESETTWLAALLHDLGKFWQRSFEGRTKPHEEYGRLFVENEFAGYFKPCGDYLGHAIAHHHHPHVERDIEKQVIIADRLSANEREKEVREQEVPSRAALLALFSRPPIAPRETTELAYTLGEINWLSADTFFPTQEGEATPQKYAELWQQFQQEFAKLADRRGYQSADFTTIMALLRKYCSRMPAATPWEGQEKRTIPDISLFDHLKTTAAIAACLVPECSSDELDQLVQATAYRPSDTGILDKPLCALVKGDISGTQDFLYLLTAKGAARGLRGRSFYLQLLTESIARWIVRQFHLQNCNILMTGGGHFYLLLPYRQTELQMDRLGQQIAKRLWRAHRGDLTLTIGYVPVTARDFLETADGGHAFADKWDEVSRHLNGKKLRRWRDLDDPEFFGNLFTPKDVGGVIPVCDVCRNEGQLQPDGDVKKCRRCLGFEDLGRQLRQPKYLVFFEVEEIEPPEDAAWHDALRCFGNDVWLCDDLEAQSPPVQAASATIYRLDAVEFLGNPPKTWNNLPVSFDFYWLADATPRLGNGDIADFSDLAKASQGVKWLGVLRMDVDDLGQLFRSRLGSSGTISRMSTLSESLRLFFEGWVPQACRNYNERSVAGSVVYLTYAGGDDLFLVGGWSVLPELASIIRSDFQRYVGGDHISVSAGIAIEHQKYPLYQLADDAKRALDNRAKEFARPNGRMKDAICFLQTAMGWEEFREGSGWQHRVREMLIGTSAEKPLARGFLSRLMEIHALYKQNKTRRNLLRRKGVIRTDDELRELIHFDRWQWRLVYQLGRFREGYPHFEGSIQQLQEAIAREQEGLISILNVLARWTSLLIREE